MTDSDGEEFCEEILEEKKKFADSQTYWQNLTVIINTTGTTNDQMNPFETDNQQLQENKSNVSMFATYGKSNFVKLSCVPR